MLRQDVHAPAARQVAVPRPRNPVPWLVAAVVILVAAVLALGAMVVRPMVTTTPAQATVDRLIAAWNEFNEAELRAVYTEDAFLWMNIDTEPTASGIDEIVDTARYAGLTVEAIGPVSERGNLVWVLSHVTNSYDVSGSDEVTVFFMENGRVAQQWVIWDELE
ncbi:MAG TPA: nuclear transport factor 2 family protein [Candidatus Limnocylindrales bacterium]|nr:nuclear transport factor 2 family protein [Candidatus Limnocylindrales bacterium]